MKNLQTAFLNILASAALFFIFPYASAQSNELSRADSLFHAKQYTQSLELYQNLFARQKYSPAMLLKMAYIQEGLGKIGQTLYYLKLYHLATDDEQALQKMEELAAKYRLSGYESNDASRLQQLIDKKISWVELGLGCILLVAAWMFYITRRKEKRPWVAACIMIIVSGAILYLNNAYTTTSVIVTTNNTYAMEGPSSGAPVVSILAEGNQLQLLGQTDVWLKVKWLDKTAFVKKNAVLTVAL